MSDVPLQGKNILIPRGKLQAKAFSEAIKEHGGVPIEIPLIGFRPTQIREELQQAIEQIDQYDWLIITSINSARFFLTKIPANLPSMPKIAAIGEKTERVIKELGFNVAFIPSEYVAEGFVKEFLPIISQGEKALLPKGDLARGVIVSALQKNNIQVNELIIYETFLPEESKQQLMKTLTETKLHILTFTSSSTVDHFMAVVNEAKLHDKIKESIVACIGPIAKKTAESHGLTVHVCPSIYTVDAMILQLIHYVSETRLEAK